MSDGGIRPGYKQTEVGVIPEDWEVEPFGHVFRKIPSKSYQIQTSEYREMGLFPIVDQGQKRIVGYCDVAEKLFVVPESGAIIFGDHTCIVKLVLHDFVVGADGTQILVPKSGHSATFHAFALEHRGVEATGYNRHFKFLKERAFLSPPPPEQRAIAQALADADGVIAGLEAVIAKKRDLKQAAMQHLLTGETRLPGFSGEWEVKRLGDVCAMRSGEGITAKDIDDVSTYPCFGGNGLRGYTTRFTHNGRFALIGRVGALCGNVMLADGKFFASEHAIVVTPFNHFDVGWLAVILDTLGLNRRAESSAQPVLTVSKLLILEVLAPPLKAEQTAIAKVLSDMDADLAALSARLAKARAVKQGMMQQLLTGKVRLV